MIIVWSMATGMPNQPGIRSEREAAWLGRAGLLAVLGQGRRPPPAKRNTVNGRWVAGCSAALALKKQATNPAGLALRRFGFRRGVRRLDRWRFRRNFASPEGFRLWRVPGRHGAPCRRNRWPSLDDLSRRGRCAGSGQLRISTASGLARPDQFQAPLSQILVPQPFQTQAAAKTISAVSTQGAQQQIRFPASPAPKQYRRAIQRRSFRDQFVVFQIYSKRTPAPATKLYSSAAVAADVRDAGASQHRQRPRITSTNLSAFRTARSA